MHMHISARLNYDLTMPESLIMILTSTLLMYGLNIFFYALAYFVARKSGEYASKSSFFLYL